MSDRRWRWHQWLVAGPLFGGLVIGTSMPVLFLVQVWVDGTLPPWEIDVGIVYMFGYMAGVAAVWGAVAGLGAGIVCAVITAPVEWHGRPTHRFYPRLAVGVTAPLAALVGAHVHRSVPGFDLGLFPVTPICFASFVAYRVGALVGNDGRPRPRPSSS
jgi:hypothetical protein